MNLKGLMVGFTTLLTTTLFIDTVIALPTSTNFTEEVEARSLYKRGCVVSQYTNGLPLCNDFSVTMFQAAMNLYWTEPTQNRLSKNCLFYLNLGKEQGIRKGSEWYCAMRPTGPGLNNWNNCLPAGYQSVAFSSVFSAAGGGLDILGPLVSQALAETCQGDVYFFTPSSQDPSQPATNVWWTHEYPALTRNPKVTSIIRVDPTLKDDEGNFQDDGEVIWVQGDPATSELPGGTGYTFNVPQLLFPRPS